MVTVPGQLAPVIDRDFRVAIAERPPTATILPADAQKLDYSAPADESTMVPSSSGANWHATVKVQSSSRTKATKQ